MRIKRTPDGKSSAVIFLEWVKNVFVPEVQTLQTSHQWVVLLLDGSKTHVSLEAIKELKALGVEVVVFPPHLIDVIQPLDKAVFRSVKNNFTKHETKWKTLHNHRAPTTADFVCFWTTAFYDSVTPKNIEPGFDSCGIAPFNPNNFLVQCAPERIRQVVLHATACASVSTCSASPSRSDTNSRPFAEKCTGRNIYQDSRHDPWSLRLGGLVTEKDFIDRA